MSPILLKALAIYALAACVSMLIAGLIKLIVLLLGRLDRPPVARPGPGPRAAPVAAPIPPAHIAAIAAAVHAALGAHRIVHIEDQRSSGRWGAEGRSAHHHSHAVPTHKPPH
jgi:hypothetical protein